jgi:hypothetical protein
MESKFGMADIPGVEEPKLLKASQLLKGSTSIT